MVSIVLVLLIVGVGVFGTLRAYQWATRSGPYDPLAARGDGVATDRRSLRDEIQQGRQRETALTADDLDDPWREGEEFGPPDDGPGRSR